MNELKDFLALELVGGNTVENFLMAFFTFIFLYLFFRIFRSVVIARLAKLAKKTEAVWDDYLIAMVEGIPPLFFYALSLYVPVRMLIRDDGYGFIVDGIFFAVVVFQISVSLISLLEFCVKSYLKSKDPDSDPSFTGFKILLKIVIWSLAVILILSNSGVNVSSLVTGLGISGIAVALAVQNILGDMFSSFTIYFDKPFKEGDFITVGDDSGTVKKIGLKSTRIATLHGEELVVSNQELVNSRVQNYRGMRKRRVVLSFGVVYGASVKDLKKVNELVEKVINGVKGVTFDRGHFSDFSASSLDFEIIYYVNSGDYLTYMNAKQEVNLGVKGALQKAKIEMAYPTQTLHLVK
ncbi:mechanosensitive ion channel family protein [Candidatus Gracilibacteria bacterium]|nr:mechanosensitive ion channel family protein [Candidatus Gracilibacteria bacterium]